MPLKWLLLGSVALQAGCSLSLRHGDRALAEARYEEAISYYEEVWKADADAVLFRMALIRAIPDNPMSDAAQARNLFEQVTRKYPKSAYAIASRLMVSRLKQQSDLETRLRTVEEELGLARAEVSMNAALQEQELQSQRTQVAKLTEERDRLQGELKTLRDEHAELVLLRQERVDLQQLRTENTRLKEALEELKKIDLRR